MRSRKCAVICFVSLATACGALPGAAIEPDLGKCFLQIGQQTLNPTAVVSHWRIQYDVGQRTFCVDRDEVADSPPAGDAKPWSAKSDDGHCLHWLAANSNTAYLVGYEVDKEGRFTRYDSPPRLRRLNLATGSWLADLPVASGHPTKEIVSVTADDQDVVVLTRFSGHGPRKDDEDTVTGYDILCFRQGATKALWTKAFPCSGERPYTGGYLWGIPPPEYAGSDIQHVSWMGDRLLVCPEALQPIYCLNRDTGSEIWHLGRVWEFQRGFIGPSVWSHYIARFGFEEFDAKARSSEKARKEFDKQFTCALVAGPIAVPLQVERGNATHSIFVAVSRGPAGAWAGYLSDCIVYEINDGGAPISMATLPQMVKGSQHSVRRDGVIWRCQNDTFVKVSPVRSAPVVSMGGGGADGTACVAWLRHLPYAEPVAWLSAGKAQDAVVFGDSHAFCLPAGGYVARKNAPIYRFPISAVDLSTGLDTDLLLNVPFKGEIPIPASNYSSRTLPDGTQGYHTLLYCELAVTGLQVHHNQLEIVLGMEKWAASVRFDVSKALGQRQISTERPEASDPMQNARTRVKALDPKSLNETLSSAANGNDVAFLRALLEAGADPKVASENGWTALMVAATYGTAEMVDALVAAGSDVNASDGNCGGQTVLMWAARSGKESKRKVQSLLKAGANKDGTSQNGFNALMSAAMAGDLATVELLLQAGLKASHRDNEGQTVLMVASRSGNGNVVKALIDAGADVQATDNKGMTALMHAADGVSTAEATKTLLAAGADKRSKDRSGRTALQIAEASHCMGADQVVELLKSGKQK